MGQNKAGPWVICLQKLVRALKILILMAQMATKNVCQFQMLGQQIWSLKILRALKFIIPGAKIALNFWIILTSACGCV